MTTSLKLNVQHWKVRSLDTLDSWVENRILDLGRARQIDEANLLLMRSQEARAAPLSTH